MKNEEQKRVFRRIGERIQYIRKVDEVTIEELSRRTNLSIEQIQKWEMGESEKFPVTDICLIAKSLGVGIEYLFSFELEDSIETYFLAYKLSLLPEGVQEKLLEVLDHYMSKELHTVDFWNELVSMMADGNSELLEKFKARIEELADEYES